MGVLIRTGVVVMGFFLLQCPLRAEEVADTTAAQQEVEREVQAVQPVTEMERKPVLDLEHENTYLDIHQALQSEKFVHRAVLSALIEKTSGVSFNRLYLNHLMGFTAVMQKAGTPGVEFMKFNKAAQGVSIGYVFDGGHGIEAGVEISGVSSLFAGYRFFWQSAGLSFWPMAGLGAGMELSGVRISDVPVEAERYVGKDYMGFLTLGLLVPLIDVGLKVEFRGQFYGSDRIVLSQGVGAIIFL